jgi:thioester reductase-like protein
MTIRKKTVKKKAKSTPKGRTARATGSRSKSRSRSGVGGRRQILITGYPGFIGKELVRKLIKAEPDSTFYLLVQSKFVDDARKYIRSFRRQNLDKINILSGDIASMHLGLSAEELKRVARSVTDIYHLAAISYLGVTEKLMWKVNVKGTQNLLEVADQARNLSRFNHVSTCYVSGNRRGVITEDELDEGQSFRNVYESTKFEAEKRVLKAGERLPVSIYRPAIVVGNSKTGEISRFDGPYFMGLLLASSPVSVPLPLPGKGIGPLNMVPVDYVVDAIYHLSLHPQAIGKTFHLVDPNPLSVRKVYELIAARAGRKPPRLSVSAGLAKVILKIPGLEKVSRAHRQAIDYVNTLAIYNNDNTEELLWGSPIVCPPFESYLDNLMAYVRATYQARKQREELAEDPLA